MSRPSPSSSRPPLLTAEERSAVAAALAPVAAPHNVAASCVYGSRVAGYAKADSDYDVLLVLAPFRPGVRYRYLKGPVPVSALLVDQRALERDADRAALGEFVIGRLLNVYEPLQGAALCWDLEVHYKKRVMAELLAETVALYRAFLPHLRLPLEYFLFEKLRRRAAVYPPALYSYIRTYSGMHRRANLAATRQGFAEAARRLRDEGGIDIEDGNVHVRPTGVRPPRFARLSRLLQTTERGVRQYATHGRAGRVSWRIVGLEARAKLVRAFEAREMPEDLRHPRNVWRVPEGFLVVDTDDWLVSLREQLGVSAAAPVAHRPLGEGPNVSRAYQFQEGARQIHLVVKRYRDPRSVKWALLNVWALPTTHFEISPLTRLAREYGALVEFRAVGVHTPKVAGVFLGERILVTHFVEGPDLGHVLGKALGDPQDEWVAVRQFGELLGRLHMQGFALGDAKPSNVVVNPEGLYLTDLEQVRVHGDRAWDVAEFLYFSTKLTLSVAAAERLARAFLEGYVTRGDRDTLRAAMDLRYLAPFQPVMALTVARAVRKRLREAAAG